MSVMNSAEDEKRRQKRIRADGPVTLWCMDCTPSRIEGQVTDTSEEGFRVVHRCAALGAGRQVRFEHAGAEGIARTVWTRIVADSVESGFQVIQRDQNRRSPGCGRFRFVDGKICLLQPIR